MFVLYTATDHTHKMAEQMSNSVLSGKQDANRIFKVPTHVCTVIMHKHLVEGKFICMHVYALWSMKLFM